MPSMGKDRVVYYYNIQQKVNKIGIIRYKMIKESVVDFKIRKK